MPTFANPLGFWALLGIPAILAIHFLQRRAKHVPISTLFLLEQTQRESISGRRFDRLVPSIPLWLQLLAVLLLAWLLAQPRYQRADSTQRVAIVLDGSASMQVFRDSLRQALDVRLPKMLGTAATLEITLLEASEKGAPLYSGTSIADALESLDTWQPGAGKVDPSPTLQLARSLVGRAGLVVYATDTPTDSLPFDARLLAVGEPVDNVGITGARWQREQGQWVWRAVVRNHSDQPAQRTWHLEMPGGRRTRETTFEIEADGMVSLQAALPSSADRAVLTLSPDRFTLDDRMPLLPPQPKMLRMFAATAPQHQELTAQLGRSLEATERTAVAAEADFTVSSYDPLDPQLPRNPAVIFVNDETRPGSYLGGNLVVEAHPLVKGLNWQSLLVRETFQLERRPTDDVLLWQGNRPLLFLRTLAAKESSPAAPQLCFNFDPAKSNLGRQPAFIVCLHRFIEGIRSRKVAPTRQTLETSQPVSLAARPGQAVTWSVLDASFDPIRSETQAGGATRQQAAPDEPGFLEVEQDGQRLLEAAVYFADTREADFRDCRSNDPSLSPGATSMEQHTREDAWWRLWVVLLFLALGVSWYFSGTPRRSPVPA